MPFPPAFHCALFLLHGDKLVLGRAADGAGPVSGQIFKRGARSDAGIRITIRRIVDIATDRAFIAFHGENSLLISGKTTDRAKLLL